MYYISSFHFFQTKVKTLRQTYEKARDRLAKSGVGTHVKGICPYFDQLDSFLGCRPLASPHYKVTSADSRSSSSSSSSSSPTFEIEALTVSEKSGETVIDKQAPSATTDDDPQPLPLKEALPDLPEGDSDVEEPEGGKKRIYTPGKYERRQKKKKQKLDSIPDSMQELVQDDKKFLQYQQKMWEEYSAQQKAALEERQKDRDIMKQLIDQQHKESQAMTKMMGDMISMMTQKNESFQIPQQYPEYYQPSTSTYRSDSGEGYKTYTFQQL
jgi:hypothetical protein